MKYKLFTHSCSIQTQYFVKYKPKHTKDKLDFQKRLYYNLVILYPNVTSYPVKYKYAARMSTSTSTEDTTSFASQLERDSSRSLSDKVENVRPLSFS